MLLAVCANGGVCVHGCVCMRKEGAACCASLHDPLLVLNVESDVQGGELTYRAAGCVCALLRVKGWRAARKPARPATSYEDQEQRHRR